jgi:hypothetical protein
MQRKRAARMRIIWAASSMAEHTPFKRRGSEFESLAAHQSKRL